MNGIELTFKHHIYLFKKKAHYKAEVTRASGYSGVTQIMNQR